tara:strand:- start:18131 stop:18637 length:507 start_codon:yes stop_codon:yes gene_type:complete
MNRIKFSIVLDHKQDVFREIEIDENDSLMLFHQIIVHSFQLSEGEMAAFYFTDDDWSQEDEIPLVSMDDSITEMSQIKVKDVFKSPDSKMLYINDFLLLWRFMITVEQITENEKGQQAKEVLKFGEMPLDAPSIQFVSENEDNEDEDGEENDLFYDGDLNEFEEFNEY